MIGYYTLIDKLKTILDQEPFINTITKGGIDQVDLQKVSLYPICHISINNSRIESSTIVYNVSFILMDILDHNKKESSHVYYSHDNEDDIINQMNEQAIRIYELFRRGAFHNNGMQLVDESANIEYFSDRFVDKVAGCTLTLDVALYNNGTIC
jgi:hypothetical protein